MSILVRTPLRPTEDPEKVARAIKNLFPDARIAEAAGELVAEATSLDRLAEVIANHRIPDSARSGMLRGHDHGAATLTFRLGKQAAFAGRPHFAPPASALGDLVVTLVRENEEALLRWVYATAPDTTVPPELATVPGPYRPRDGEEGRAGARGPVNGAPAEDDDVERL